MTELVLPEIVDEQFKEHYQELIRSSLLRAVEADEQQPRKRGRRRRAQEDPLALNGILPGPAAPVEPPPPWPAVAPEAVGRNGQPEPAVAPEYPPVENQHPPPVEIEHPPPVENQPPPPVENAPAWPAVAPAAPAALQAPEAAHRSRQSGAIRIVWLVAVVLLVANAFVFGIDSWAAGFADLAVLVLTVGWFLVSSDARRAAPVDAPVPVAEPEPEPEPEPDREPEPQAVEGIAGLQVIPLQMERDAGGHVTKLLQTSDSPACWRAVSCRAGTLRGMHAHVRTDGCRIVVEGKVALGLKDLRPGSASEGCAELLELSADEYTGVVIPAGVAHGLYAHTDALVLVALTEVDEEERGCAWNDPGLGIEWPGEPQFLSDRDRRAGPLEVLAEELAARLSRPG